MRLVLISDAVFLQSRSHLLLTIVWHIGILLAYEVVSLVVLMFVCNKVVVQLEQDL